MKVLFIGDIVGKPGRRALKQCLPELIDKLKIDFVIANVENAAGGFGITEPVGKEILSRGVNVMTSGNHIWDKKEVLSYIPKEDRLLRPANYPDGVPGNGHITINVDKNLKIGILNLSGRVFMPSIDCPFRTAERIIPSLKEETKIIIVDFHAEATSEKLAMGWFLDGKVSAVIGTHTHVQTADERILPNGTAYITDVGMTGPINSIIGVRKEKIINKFLTQIPTRFETASGEVLLCSVILDIDPDTGLANSIQRLQISYSA
jgi:hypothetical protein